MAQTETQAPMMEMQKPVREHMWLRKLVGDWEIKGWASMGPGEARSDYTSSECVRALGDLWIIGEATMEDPNVEGVATNVITIGYDTTKKRFVGSFISSMMNFMWVYDGYLDADEKVLTLESEGPGFMGGAKTARFRDVIEVKDDDNRMLRSYMLGPDGEWSNVMESEYKRC